MYPNYAAGLLSRLGWKYPAEGMPYEGNVLVLGHRYRGRLVSRHKDEEPPICTVKHNAIHTNDDADGNYIK